MEVDFAVRTAPVYNNQPTLFRFVTVVDKQAALPEGYVRPELASISLARPTIPEDPEEAISISDDSEDDIAVEIREGQPSAKRKNNSKLYKGISRSDHLFDI